MGAQSRVPLRACQPSLAEQQDQLIRPVPRGKGYSSQIAPVSLLDENTPLLAQEEFEESLQPTQGILCFCSRFPEYNRPLLAKAPLAGSRLSVDVFLQGCTRVLRAASHTPRLVAAVGGGRQWLCALATLLLAVRIAYLATQSFLSLVLSLAMASVEASNVLSSSLHTQ